MTKDLIKYLISYYQDFVSKITFEERQYSLEPNANYVYVGLRRAGKSYLMYQQIHHLLEQGHSLDEIEVGDVTIHVVPAWKWLLN